MKQMRKVEGLNGESLLVVMVSDAEMRVLRHAIRSSTALQLPGRVASEVSPQDEELVAVTDAESRQTVLFMVGSSSIETDPKPQKVRWIRARKDKGLLTFLNGPLLDIRSEFSETAPETFSPVARASTIFEESVLGETIKIAA